jgi:hypothetical protein
VLLFDPPNSWKLSKQHQTWAWPCLIIGLAACAWYGVTWAFSDAQPGGSSWPGIVSGIAAGLLMLYLFAYALRKVPVFSAWFGRAPTKYWLRQHIWLGLLTVPLVVAHAARISYWSPLTMALLGVYALVIISGVWGLCFQQRVPTRLLEEIPDETIRSHIPELTNQLRAQAELLVLATCGPPKEGGPAAGLATLEANRKLLHASHGKGSWLLAMLPPRPIPDTEALRRYFYETLDPYLGASRGTRSHLQLLARLETDFRDLHARLPTTAHPVIDALADLCKRRRQFDEQARLHAWLHTWVGVHLSLSAILVVLLVCHIATAFIHW